MDKDVLLSRLRDVGDDVSNLQFCYNSVYDEFERFIKEVGRILAADGVNVSYEIGVLTGKVKIRRGDDVYSIRRLISDIEKIKELDNVQPPTPTEETKPFGE